MENINRFIIHELVKYQEPNTADSLLDLGDDIVSGLAGDILSIYRKKVSVIYGKFRDSGAFPKDLNTYLNSVDDTNFINLTKLSMTSLADKMEGTSGTGGYICFIEYETNKGKRLLVSMIKNTAGVKLKKLKPEVDIHIDKSKLYQALDISISGYQEALRGKTLKDSYLGFISKSGEPSGYFQQAFSCTSNVVPSKAVKKTPPALKAFLEQYTSDKRILKDARAALIGYFKDNINSTVRLRRINDIANAYLPEDAPDDAKDSFIEFVKSEQWQLPEEFNAVKGSVDSLSRLTYTSENVTLNFERNLLGDSSKQSDSHKSILFDAKNKEILIKDLSDGFVQDLLKELDMTKNDE